MNKPPRNCPGKKSKVDANQLALDFPVTRALLPLEKEEIYSLSRELKENSHRVKKYWEDLVTKGGFVKQLAKNQKVWVRPGYGLIYRHFIDGKVRYIGQTSRWSLRERLKQRFSNGLVGYDYDIQRCLLNAFWKGIWKIKTEQVKLEELDEREAELISFYAHLNKLWNKDYNPYFRESNFDV